MEESSFKEVVFNFAPHNCWAAKLSNKYPKCSLIVKPLGHFFHNGKCINKDYFQLKASKKEDCNVFHKKIMDSIGIANPLSVSKSKNYRTYLYTYSYKDQKSLYITLAENNAIMLDDIIHINDAEIWKVLCPTNKIQVILEEFRLQGPTKIISIKDPGEPENNLTNMEQISLNTAIFSGYYSWPRGVTLEELGKKLGLSRRGFQDNLRRAESKIMNKASFER